MAKGMNKNFWWLLLLLTMGVVIGGFIGNLVGNAFPALKFGYTFGVSTHTWDLIIIQLTFGLKIAVNMFTIVGLLIAIVIYRRF